MKKGAIFLVLTLSFCCIGMAQRPQVAPPQKQTLVIKNALVHTAAGEPIQDGAVISKNGIITYVGTIALMPSEPNATVIDAKGLQLFPGLIALDSHLGLSEIESVRATRDFSETGDENPNVRSLIAFNTDSRVIPTVRSNGVLHAQIAPQSGTFSGLASVVHFDAWNYEDAALATDNALFMNWPEMMAFEAWWAPSVEKQQEQAKEALSKIETLFEAAKSFNQIMEQPNLKLQSLKLVLDKHRKLFIRANSAKSIISALDFCRKYDIKPVIVGAADSKFVLSWLKQYSSGVVLGATHSLPRYAHSPVFDAYELPKVLAEAEIPFAITIDGFWQQRNLAFQAGTATAFGLNPLMALQAITLQPAKLAGVDKLTGSIEVGKHADLVLCTGDLLDMQSSVVMQAFIKGRAIDLTNAQKELYRIFAEKYGISPKP